MHKNRLELSIHFGFQIKIKVIEPHLNFITESKKSYDPHRVLEHFNKYMNSELSKSDNVVSGTSNGYQHSQPENNSNYQSVKSGGAISVVKRDNVMRSNNKGRN